MVWTFRLEPKGREATGSSYISGCYKKLTVTGKKINLPFQSSPCQAKAEGTLRQPEIITVISLATGMQRPGKINKYEKNIPTISHTAFEIIDGSVA